MSLDGRPIKIPRGADPFVKSLFIAESRAPLPLHKDELCLANVQKRIGVVMTRTCEGAKDSGLKRVYPCVWVAPIRPISDFDDVDPEHGEGFAKKILEGFPTGEGEVDECYRFWFMPPCQDHAVDAGIICFREMQPIHTMYLLQARKLAKMSIPEVKALMQRFAEFTDQREKDNETDSALGSEPSKAVQRWTRQIQKNKQHMDALLQDERQDAATLGEGA